MEKFLREFLDDPYSGEPDISQMNLLSSSRKTRIDPAEVNVPDHLRSKDKEKSLLKNTRFSRKIGVCMFLADLDFDYPKERLNFYQSIATEEAIIAGIRTFERLKEDSKYRKDNIHLFSYFIYEKPRVRYRRVKSKIFRRGYQDKGTLPDLDSIYRREANREAFMDIRSLREESQEFLKTFLPEDLFEGSSLDLPETFIFLQEEEEILKKLRLILRDF